MIVGTFAVLRSRGRSRGSPEQGYDRADVARHVAEVVAPLRRPCVLLRKAAGESRSYLGGLPPRYPGFVWPSKGDYSLAFLACIDLSEVRGIEWVPRKGLLLFFYDMEEYPWGYEPAHRGGWAVLHVKDPAAVAGVAPAPAGLDPDWRLPRRSLTLEPVSMPPPWDLTPLDTAGLSKTEWEARADALEDLRDSLYGTAPKHQLGGYPEPIQNAAMDEECQLASNGINCGTPEGYRDPRVESLKHGASEWKLLFQMDSDDDLNVMWGDAGMLYFWVREQEARAGDFSRAWLIMQCS